MNSPTVFAYVTTFNRLELLKKVIAGLRKQVHAPDRITVINNGSTDGTAEWLAQENIPFISQPNVGSSGGQWRAVTEGTATQADYIWIMDDDVVPEAFCLQNLLAQAAPDRIICPIRFGSDGSLFENEPIRLNMNNPFKSIWGKIIDKTYLEGREFAPAEGLTFEGPLIPRSLAAQIGPPEFGFFIHADDTEYMLRARSAGATLGIVPAARLDRLLPLPDINAEFTWKHYYVIRNVIALDILHGSPAVRFLRPFFYLQAWLRRANSSEDRRTALRAFKDGYSYKKASETEIQAKINPS